MSTPLRILCLLIAMAGAVVSRAGESNWTGAWTLVERANLAGQEYLDAVPTHAEFTLAESELRLREVFKALADHTRERTRNFNLRGLPATEQGESGIQSATARVWAEGQALVITTEFLEPGPVGKVKATRTEHWLLTEAGTKLRLFKTYQTTDRTKIENCWEIEATYSRDQSAGAEVDGPAGIKFESDLTWPELLAKANREGKSILVDCYASWCAPCKEMEADVYPDPKVGQSINRRYLAVKVRLDLPVKEETPQSRSLKAMVDQAKVVALPTYLFVAGNGVVVDRAVGYQSAYEFIGLATRALDPQFQYDTLMREFQVGNRDALRLRRLALAALARGDKESAAAVAKVYKQQVVDQLPVEALCSREDLQLAGRFSQEFIFGEGSHGKMFALFSKYSAYVDYTLGQRDLAEWAVRRIITSEAIEPVIWPKGVAVSEPPDWERLAKGIRQKYGETYAERVVLDAQIKWSHDVGAWAPCIRWFVEKVERFGPESLGELPDNAITSLLLPHCDDPIVLNKAISWMEALMAARPNYQGSYGNYAGLLYKAGRTAEGISWYEKYLKNWEGYDKPEVVKQKRDVLMRMQKGEKINETWPVEAFF